MVLRDRRHCHTPIIAECFAEIRPKWDKNVIKAFDFLTGRQHNQYSSNILVNDSHAYIKQVNSRNALIALQRIVDRETITVLCLRLISYSSRARCQIPWNHLYQAFIVTFFFLEKPHLPGSLSLNSQPLLHTVAIRIRKCIVVVTDIAACEL